MDDTTIPLDPAIEAEIAAIPSQVARRRVRLMIPHRGPWHLLEGAEMWPRDTCASLIRRLPPDSLLTEVLALHNAEPAVESEPRCPRCHLRGHLPGDSRCIPSITHYASARAG